MSPEHAARVRLALSLLVHRHEDRRAPVADLLAVSVQAIGRILNEQNGASAETTARLARAIGAAPEGVPDEQAARALRLMPQAEIRARVAAFVVA